MEITQAVPAAPAKRRKNRCMFKDAKSRWWLDFYTPDGKRRRKLVGESKEEADILLAKLKLAKASGGYVDGASAPTFEAFCDIFADRHGNHLPSYRRTSYLMERLKKFFGKKRLSQITAGNIEQYRHLRRDLKQRWEGESTRKRLVPVQYSTINREVTVIRSMLAKAVKWGFISRNPSLAVEDYKTNSKRARFLSNEEMRSLLRATKSSKSPFLRPAVYLAWQTGMRKAEILGLCWSDVNFEASKILARKTKNGKPRHVPMSRRARWVLAKLAARNPLATFVFESKDDHGTPGPTLDVKTAWHSVLRAARIEDFHFHDLRHTFASHFAMKGGNLFALAEILGHSNPKITIDTYAHLSPEFMNAMRRVMDATYVPSMNGQSMDTRNNFSGTGVH